MLPCQRCLPVLISLSRLIVVILQLLFCKTKQARSKVSIPTIILVTSLTPVQFEFIFLAPELLELYAVVLRSPHTLVQWYSYFPTFY